MLYVAEFGVAKDHNEAARWYRKAAQQGHAELLERLFEGAGAAQRAGEPHLRLGGLARPRRAVRLLLQHLPQCIIDVTHPAAEPLPCCPPLRQLWQLHAAAVR